MRGGTPNGPQTSCRNAHVTLATIAADVRISTATFQYVTGCISAPSNHREGAAANKAVCRRSVSPSRYAGMPTKNYAGELAKARRRVEDARAQLEMKRQSLTAPKLDRNDLRRLTSALKPANTGAPCRATERQAELSKGNPRMSSAITEAPLGMSGVDPAMHDLRHRPLPAPKSPAGTRPQWPNAKRRSMRSASLPKWRSASYARTPDCPIARRQPRAPSLSMLGFMRQAMASTRR